MWSRTTDLRCRRPIRRAAFALLAGLALVLLSACGGDEPYAYAGSAYVTPDVGPDFTLTSPGGAAVRLSDFRGQVVALFFGYTHCPDVCPTALADLHSALALLPEDERAQVQVIMVTVDPERDSPAVLGEYLARIDPTFLGLSGDAARIQQVLRQWGLPSQKEAVQADGSYSMLHPSYTIVLDREGVRRLRLPLGLAVPDIAADLRHLLAA